MTNIKTLTLEDWFPHQFSVVAGRVSTILESMYGEQFGLTVPGWRVMAVLGQEAPLSAKEVAERLAMDPVGVSRAISHLTTLGLISRRVDVEDRRRIVLKLNKKGLNAYSQIAPVARAIEQKLLASLSQRERAALQAICKKLVENTELVLPPNTKWKDVL